jgi:hypothetical protein
VRTVNRHIAAGKLQSRLSPEGRREVLVDLPEGDVESVASATSSAVSSAPSAAPFSFEAKVSAAGAAVTDSGTGASSQTAAPANSSPRHAAAAHQANPFSQAPSPGVSVDPETVLALADNAAQKAEMAVAAYQTLARLADTQVQQIRRNARLAWAAVAVMAVGVTGAVGYTTHRLTRATVERENLQDELVSATDTVRQLSAGQDTLRAERIEAERTLRAELIARQDELSAERAAAEQALRTELSAAKDQAARAEGKLTAYVEQEQARLARETLAASAAPAPAAPATSAEPPPNRASAMADIFELGGNPSQQLASGSVVELSDKSVDRPTTRPSEADSSTAAATRPSVASRRKPRPVTGSPATRPATSDTTSASTADER